MANREKIIFNSISTSRLMSIGIPVTKTKLSDIHIDQLMEHINDYEQQNQIKKALIL
ncbi:unnamed protein product, partial [Rotaria socialis]